MPELGTLAAFSAVTLVLVATPGPGFSTPSVEVLTTADGGFASMLGIESAELLDEPLRFACGEHEFL